ncbi:hypothetical protein, partial [Mycobacterium tuberculosis]
LGFWLACASTAGYLGYRYSRLYGRVEGWTIAAAFASGWASIYLLAGILLDSASVQFAHWLGLFAAIAAGSGLVLADVRGMGSRLAASVNAENNNRRDAVLRLVMQGAGTVLLLVLISYTAISQMDRLLEQRRVQAGDSELAVGAREGNLAPAIELTDLSGDSV